MGNFQLATKLKLILHYWYVNRGSSNIQVQDHVVCGSFKYILPISFIFLAVANL